VAERTRIPGVSPGKEKEGGNDRGWKQRIPLHRGEGLSERTKKKERRRKHVGTSKKRGARLP